MSDRVTTAYTLEGPQGAPFLILANSLGATPTMWDRQVAAWRRHFQVLRYSYRGHGATPAFGQAASMADLARDLLLLLDGLGIRRFHFVGLSLGGMLGLQLAAAVPDRVAKLVAANCRYYQTEDSRAQWEQRIALVRQNGIDAIADGTADRWLTPAYRAAQPQDDTQIRAMIRSTSADGYAACAAAVRDFDARDAVERISCPTLFISGTEDAAAPADHMAGLAQRVRGSRYLPLPCAHLSNIECSEAFTRAVLEFLDMAPDTASKETA